MTIEPNTAAAIATVTKLTEKGFTDIIDSIVGGKITINKAKSSAKAEIEVEKIKMEWSIYGKNKHEAMLKLKAAEINNEYLNMGKVIQKTLPKISNIQTDELKEKDNIKLILDEAKMRSDEGMQEYLASMLAQEYNEPNSISRQSIKIVQSMSRREFEIFAKYLSLCFETFLPKDYFAITNIDIFIQHGVSYDEFKRLVSLNLFDTGDSAKKISKVDNTVYGFKNCNTVYKFSLETDVFLSGIYVLTDSGLEISRFMVKKENQEYLKWAFDWFENRGLKHIE